MLRTFGTRVRFPAPVVRFFFYASKMEEKQQYPISDIYIQQLQQLSRTTHIPLQVGGPDVMVVGDAHELCSGHITPGLVIISYSVSSACASIGSEVSWGMGIITLTSRSSIWGGYVLPMIIVVTVGCRCRWWGTAVFLPFLTRRRKIGLQAPGFEAGSRTFVT